MRSLLLLVGSIAWLACGSPEPAAPPPDTPVGHTPGAEGRGPGGPVDCPPGSMPHQGEPPPGCDFVVAGCCFATAEAACAQAGCEAGGCAVLESHPAQIRCD